MPQASIELNAVVGSDDDLPINTSVQLSNDDAGDESTYLWAILSQPPGTVDSLSSTTIENPTFTPRKEGTYLLQLIVDNGLASEQRDQVIVGVRYLKTRDRVPAVGETEENGAGGWATPSATNAILERAINTFADAGQVVAVVQTAAVATGDVVRMFTPVTIKSGLPGQETVVACEPVDATSALVNGAVGVVVSRVDGNANVSTGELAIVKIGGLYANLAVTGSSIAVGNPLYVDNSGGVAETPGDFPRIIGVALEAVSTGVAHALIAPSPILGTVGGVSMLEGLPGTGRERAMRAHRDLYTNVSSGTDPDIDGNLDDSVTVPANWHGPKNVVKAWLKANGLTNEMSFGITSVVSDGGSPAGAIVTFDQAVANGFEQAVVVTGDGTVDGFVDDAKLLTVDQFTASTVLVRAFRIVGPGQTPPVQTALDDWSLIRMASIDS